MCESKSRRHVTMMAALVLCAVVSGGTARALDPELADDSNGRNWSAYGRTYGEQHYSPLEQINGSNIGRLGLAWSFDLPRGNAATGPLAIDGVIYVATGYSVARALDAATGKLLWEYDPEVGRQSGTRLRTGWGTRGIAWWNGKVYTGTQDGRLIAVEAKTGKPVWTAQTFGINDCCRFISGPPRVFAGKVIVGHGGADSGNTRGYVTAYDADTGKQLWRFYTVPGNPAVDQDETTHIAAKTWFGEWWKYGGGGTVWNSITYDAGEDNVLIGVGNGAPWNRKIRSQDKGDNLFLASIVALDAKTGKYKWHYQVSPGESWDHNAAMDMELADLEINGQVRKVVMTTPKNGFFYVIDRTNGRLLSAEPFAKVTWAERVDSKTGRPVERPEARYPNGTTAVVWPGSIGAHSWMPMAYSPKRQLVYIPTIELASSYSDTDIDLKNWHRAPNNLEDFGVDVSFTVKDADPLNGTSSLQAWDPLTQHRVWSVPTPGPSAGGVLATGGDLVFQGRIDGQFVAYNAATGRRAWSFDVQAPIVGPPISYSVNGEQQITVVVGMGTSPGVLGPLIAHPFQYRTQKRRILTFKLNGTGRLPPLATQVTAPLPDPDDARLDPKRIAKGSRVYWKCASCHGLDAVAGGTAPDLRLSPVPIDPKAFSSVVRGGILVPQGMPRFGEISDDDLEDVRQYLRHEAAEALKVGNDGS